MLNKLNVLILIWGALKGEFCIFLSGIVCGGVEKMLWFWIKIIFTDISLKLNKILTK